MLFRGRTEGTLRRTLVRSAGAYGLTALEVVVIDAQDLGVVDTRALPGPIDDELCPRGSVGICLNAEAGELTLRRSEVLGSEGSSLEVSGPLLRLRLEQARFAGGEVALRAHPDFDALEQLQGATFREHARDREPF